MKGRLLVVVPVYGEAEVTHALLADLARERDIADVVIVDNKGDYPSAGWEQVLRPDTNLGWAGGTNHGTSAARADAHVGFVWLNNDTRLSAGFLAGLHKAARRTRAALVAPVYDCYWLHQRVEGRPSPQEYVPHAVHRDAVFVDGTCMYVPASTIDDHGLLDAEAFAPLGWGAEVDYGLRLRAAGARVVVTRAAFLHHERAVTAQAIYDDYDSYLADAYPAMLDGLEAKWGDWQSAAGIDPVTHQTERLPSLDRLHRVIERQQARLGLVRQR